MHLCAYVMSLRDLSMVPAVRSTAGLAGQRSLALPYPVLLVSPTASLPVWCLRGHERIDDSRSCRRYKGVPRRLPHLFVSRPPWERLLWVSLRLRSGVPSAVPACGRRAFGDARRVFSMR